MKLRNKIFVATTGLFIVLLIAFSVAIYVLFAEEAYDRELNRLDQEAQAMTSNVHDLNSSVETEDLLRAYVPSNGAIRVVNQSFEMMTSVTANRQVGLYRASLPEKEGRVVTRLDEIDGSTVSFVQQPIIWNEGDVVYVQMVERLDALDETLANLQLVILLVTLIAIVPVVISGKLVADLVLEPIQSLIQTMTRIKENETFQEISLPKRSKDELFTMSQTFNDMIRLLKANFEKQEQFVSNASHELRTPITVIESYANLVKRRGYERLEVVEEAIEAIHNEARRMRDLTEQLLLLAKRDQDWQLNTSKVHLDALVQDVANHMHQAYERTVFVDALPTTRYTDEGKLKQLLYILLDNALKYSDSSVDLTLDFVDDNPVIIVRDYGIGIPNVQQEQIFERFYRVDESRQRATGGSGLGLALAKELADVLDASLDLSSTPGEGTTVKVIL
ncbi:sensor histidine kinase [Alkalibacillus sp. S2W]|uniref:sensor histidine kinase n=1 Tax=Alkalibacillus sp. S2W TaxID=3386553 RepID=UPI00398CFA54